MKESLGGEIVQPQAWCLWEMICPVWGGGMILKTNKQKEHQAADR